VERAYKTQQTGTALRDTSGSRSAMLSNCITIDHNNMLYCI